jgi:hypothetical protein
MRRITTITGPDGKVTTVVTRSSGCGCLTILAAIVVFFLPATFGAWAVPAYSFLGVLVLAAIAAQLRPKMHRTTPTPKPPPEPAPPLS